MQGNRRPERSTADWSHRSVGMGRALALAVIAMGGLVLAGWILDLAALVRVRDGLPAMNPLTAACFVVAGLAVALLSDGEAGRHARHGRWLALVVASVGALQFLGPTPLGEALASFLAAAWGGRPGWVLMAPATAAALVLVGVGLAVIDSPRLAANRWGQAALLAAVAPALLSAGLYVFGAPLEPVLPFLRPMAVHTALTLAALVIAGLFIRPRGSVMAVATGDSIGNVMFRFMLPVVIVVPMTLGSLHVIGRDHTHYDPSQGAAMVATVTAMLLVVGLWFVARGIVRADAARRDVEQALAESTLRLDLVLRSVGVGVWSWDVGSDSVAFDDTVAGFWQVEPGSPITMKQVAQHVHPDDRTEAVALARAAIRDGGEFSTSYRVVRPNGSIRVLAVRGFVTLDSRGRPGRCTGINWDVTVQHEAEAARAQLQHQQLELKDQFLSHVSHELRSPLTVIYSFVEILLDGLAGEINEQQREFLSIAQRNSIQLRQMIDDLLEVTRAQTGKLLVNVLRTELQPEIVATLEGLRPQAQERRITLANEAGEVLPVVLADPYRVRQVLINLLENALKFTPEGGTIRVLARVEAEALVVSVADSGPGIPAAEREDIFRQLYQLDCGAPASRKGLGLGLFICRELVTRMGGRIWVDGGPERGSVFSFTLPLFSPASAIAPLLTPENVARGEFSLVVVTFRPSSIRGWAERDDAAVGAAAEVLASCTLPDRDLVLPRLGRHGNEDAICVLGCAGTSEVAVLARRIEGQLPRCELLQSSRLTWQVQTRRLDVRADASETAREFAASLSSNIEAALAEFDVRRDAA